MVRQSRMMLARGVRSFLVLLGAFFLLQATSLLPVTNAEGHLAADNVVGVVADVDAVSKNDDQQHDGDYRSSLASSSLRGSALVMNPGAVSRTSSSTKEPIVDGHNNNNNSNMRKMQSWSTTSTTGYSDSPVYNPYTGYGEQETTKRGTSFKITIPVGFIAIVLIWCCCYSHQQQQEQQRQWLAMQQEQHLRNQATEQATLRATARIHDGPVPVRGTTASGPDGLVLPRLVTAAEIKVPPMRWGIAVVGTDHARITRILNDGVFYGSELEPGMKIVSINNIPINSASHATEVLVNAKGIVTIVAHSAGYFGSTDNLVAATVIKDQPYQMVGVVYKKEVSQGPLRLGAIAESSLFRTSSSASQCHDLTGGMEVVTVNNVPVQSVAQAVEVTRTAFPHVTILARRSATVAVLEAVATSSTTPGDVTAEPVASYALSSRDDPIVATAMATPVTTSDNQENNQYDSRQMQL